MNGRKIWAGILTGAMLVGICAGGVAEWQEEFKGGKVVRRTWKDESGANALAPEGYAVATRSYTDTSVTEKYFDLAGQPTQTIGGYYGRILTYGNRHRLEEVTYLDEDGKKTNTPEGYARVKIGHTSAGGVTVATYYDETDTIVLVPSLGYAQVKNDYRGTTLTRTTYYDENKKEIDSPLGYAVLVQGVNKSNRILSIQFEHADGSPAACAEGWATMKRELDKKQREISVKYYDLNGQMTDRGLGYAYEVKKWESDRAYTVSRYDAQDRQIAMGAEYMSLRREMNKAGQVIAETYLGENGSPKENAEGVATRKYEYDSEGRLSKVSFEGARGDSTENASGYAGYRETLDEDGFVANRVFLSVGGKATNTKAGYSEIRYRYDGDHQLSAKEYYDVNGNLIKQEAE